MALASIHYAILGLAYSRYNDIRRRLTEEIARAHPHVLLMFAALMNTPPNPDWELQEEFDYLILQGVSVSNAGSNADNEFLQEHRGGSEGEMNLQHNEADTSAYDETDASVDNDVEDQSEYGLQVRTSAEYLHEEEMVPLVRFPPQVPAVNNPSGEDQSQDGLQTRTPAEHHHDDEIVPVAQTQSVPQQIAPEHGLDPTDSRSDAYSLALLMATPYTPIQGPCLLDVDNPEFSPRLDENKSAEDSSPPSIDTDTEANVTAHEQPNAGHSPRSSIDIDVEHVEHVEDAEEDKRPHSYDPMVKLELTLKKVRAAYAKHFDENEFSGPPKAQGDIVVTEGYLFWLWLALMHSGQRIKWQERSCIINQFNLDKRREQRAAERVREPRSTPLKKSITPKDVEEWDGKKQAFREARKRQQYYPW